MVDFSVEITGGDLDRARQMLNVAGIPTVGPASTSRGEPGHRVLGPPGRLLYAHVAAPDAENATAQVRDVLPDGYVIVSPRAR